MYVCIGLTTYTSFKEKIGTKIFIFLGGRDEKLPLPCRWPLNRVSCKPKDVVEKREQKTWIAT